ncbi:hypothetical protein IscW_ISCW008235 [Ixodes scapularis]|uniref:Uncharacterized protein n=1 Tax=Ixodes scapularis TaxID=6945 RepID=B7PS24_IXOSC|nr:hypothetical protein IscW_ISCW008235 [Ixodes scapularis]|eukprot:XP_002401778.1 hypothetical protein IscW_ISCW008235 [Ixodes scapularis]
MISGGVKNKNLYYAKELSERVFDGSESLYDADVKSQKIDVSAFTFGVAMAFVVDEALGRHVSEDYWIYTALFGRTHTSEEAHEVLWSFVSTRRQCDIPHTAMCLVFGRRVYSLMIQGMDFFNRVFRGSNNCYDELVGAASSHVKAEFDQVDACGRVCPFMRLKAADFQDQDANKRGLAVLGYERSIMSSVPDKIDLDKAYTLYKSYVDDWLYYLYTPHSTTFPKAGVGNLPHTTDHEINFLTPALGNSTYSTHSCQPWEETIQGYNRRVAVREIKAFVYKFLKTAKVPAHIQRIVVSATAFLTGSDELTIVRGEDVEGYIMRRLKYVQSFDAYNSLKLCGDQHFWMVCSALDTLNRM